MFLINIIWTKSGSETHKTTPNIMQQAFTRKWSINGVYGVFLFYFFVCMAIQNSQQESLLILLVFIEALNQCWSHCKIIYKPSHSICKTY